MNKLLAALVAGAFAFASISAVAQGDKTVTPTTPEEQAKMKAERAEAKAAKAKMTPEEKAAAKKARRAEKAKEEAAMEKVGDNPKMKADTSKTGTKLDKKGRAAAEKEMEKGAGKSQ